MKQLKTFVFACVILLIGSIGAFASHLFAHIEADIRFTILGFLIAVFSGMYYGLQVPSNTNLRVNDAAIQ
ncbi:MAG: hypothetical protein ACXAD7_00560 [Candidatus Kariarchaeaceae archaeon]|jgi:hypothetical protein